MAKMNCEQLVTYLSEYIDQDLDEELRADAQEHLASCQNCRIVLDTTQQMIFLYRESGRQAIPAVRKESLFDRLQSSFQARIEGNKQSNSPDL